MNEWLLQILSSFIELRWVNEKRGTDFSVPTSLITKNSTYLHIMEGNEIIFVLVFVDFSLTWNSFEEKASISGSHSNNAHVISANWPCERRWRYSFLFHRLLMMIPWMTNRSVLRETSEIAGKNRSTDRFNHQKSHPRIEAHSFIPRIDSSRYHQIFVFFLRDVSGGRRMPACWWAQLHRENIGGAPWPVERTMPSGVYFNLPFAFTTETQTSGTFKTRPNQLREDDELSRSGQRDVPTSEEPVNHSEYEWRLDVSIRLVKWDLPSAD